MQINNFISHNTAFSRLDGGKNSASLLNPQKDGPDKAALQNQELEQMKQILKQNESSKALQKMRRKAIAAKKIKDLKELIRSLTMMAISDPKGAARQAARYARELAKVVKEFVAAGGTPGASGPMPTPGAAGPTSSDAPASETGVAAGNTPSGATSATAKSAQPTATAEGAPASEGENTGEGAEEAEETTAKDAKAAQDMGATLRKALEEQGEKLKKLGSEKEEDARFISDVKALVSALKNIIKTAKKQLEKEGGIENNQDISKTETALRETEEILKDGTLDSITSSLATAVNILV